MNADWLWTLALGGSVLLLAALPLLPALRELRRAQATPLHIPGDDDAGAEFFAQRMRQRLRSEFGGRAPYGDEPLPATWTRPGRDAVAGTHGRPDAPADTLIERTVRLADGCRYFGDVVAGERLDVGAGGILRAALVETGGAHLGAGTSVLRWIDAQTIDAGAGSRLLGRVTARERVRLGAGGEFRRIAAPLIEFGEAVPAAAGVLAADVDLEAATGAAFVETPGEQGRWVCRGSLRIPRGVRVTGHLIVEGELEIGDHCEILGSVKSHRGVRVGDGVRITGSLFAGPSARLGAGVSVHGMLSAESRLESGPGLTVGLPGVPASLLAPVMHLGPGSRVHGSAWASRQGRILA